MFVRYSGIIVMLIGAILLLLKAFANIMPQNNLILVIGLALVIIGYLLFIILDRAAENKRTYTIEDENVRIKKINRDKPVTAE